MTRKCPDSKDIMLIKMLSEDGRMSLTELARRMNMSHSSIRERLNDLTSANIIKIQANVNISLLGYKIAFINLEVKDYNEVNRILSLCDICPRVLFAGVGTGEYNVFIIMAAKSIDTLREIIEKAFRSSPYVSRINVAFGELKIPRFVPLRAECKEGCFCEGKICEKCKFLLERE